MLCRSFVDLIVKLEVNRSAKAGLMFDFRLKDGEFRTTSFIQILIFCRSVVLMRPTQKETLRRKPLAAGEVMAYSHSQTSTICEAQILMDHFTV